MRGVADEGNAAGDVAVRVAEAEGKGSDGVLLHGKDGAGVSRRVFGGSASRRGAPGELVALVAGESGHVVYIDHAEAEGRVDHGHEVGQGECFQVGDARGRGGPD